MKVCISWVCLLSLSLFKTARSLTVRLKRCLYIGDMLTVSISVAHAFPRSSYTSIAATYRCFTFTISVVICDGVALVCKELARTSRWNTLLVLKSIPSGLQPIYDHMMDQMYASTGPADLELCKQILASITLAYGPIHLEELVQIAGLPEEASSDEVAIKGMVELCGSFLVNRDGIVYFVHQSAKNYFDIPRRSALADLQKDMIRWCRGASKP